MATVKIYTKHLLTSFFIFLVLIGILFFSKSLIQNVIISPNGYMNSALPVGGIDFYIFFVPLIIISVLIPWIVYLLLSYNTRFDLEMWSGNPSLPLSKEQFRRLYESAPVPYVMLDEKAEIYHPNKAMLRFFGVFPEDIDGKNFFSYISVENKELLERLFQYYKAGIPINKKEVDIITKSGDIRSVQLSVFSMRNPGSFSSTGLVMIFDITEQKLLDKAKNEFVSLASHQLKSPLAATKWITEILMSNDIGECSVKQKEYIDKLHAANENMVDLVDVLLNVSRIEMGSLSADMKPTNVQELCESIFAELTFLSEKKNINIVKRYNNLFTNIQNDPKLLRIVIQNLVSNALKYTPAWGTVTVDFEESGGEKRITISDTGLGIPKAEQEHIFTKLFRADNVRGLSESQGTGLGLYLVKSVVATIGGRISFVSEENKGSAFTITL